MKTEKNICVCQGCGNEHDLNEKEDSLSASAPELLAALKFYYNECSGTPRPQMLILAKQMAEKALSKAEGKTEGR